MLIVNHRCTQIHFESSDLSHPSCVISSLMSVCEKGFDTANFSGQKNLSEQCVINAQI